MKRSHIAIWKWMQKYKSERISYKRRKVSEFIIDTQIKVGNDYFWLWVAIELNNNSILNIYLSAAERNMFVAQNFIRNLINKYGKHPVFTKECGTFGLRMLVNTSSRHHLHILVLRKAS
jgi:transposase-like protein